MTDDPLKRIEELLEQTVGYISTNPASATGGVDAKTGEALQRIESLLENIEANTRGGFTAGIGSRHISSPPPTPPRRTERRPQTQKDVSPVRVKEKISAPPKEKTEAKAVPVRPSSVKDASPKQPKAPQGPVRAATRPDDGKTAVTNAVKAGIKPVADAVRKEGQNKETAKPAQSKSSQELQRRREEALAEKQSKGLLGALKEKFAAWEVPAASSGGDTENLKDAIGTALGGPFWAMFRDTKELLEPLADRDESSLLGKLQKTIKGDKSAKDAEGKGKRDKNGRFTKPDKESRNAAKLAEESYTLAFYESQAEKRRHDQLIDTIKANAPKDGGIFGKDGLLDRLRGRGRGADRGGSVDIPDVGKGKAGAKKPGKLAKLARFGRMGLAAGGAALAAGGAAAMAGAAGPLASGFVDDKTAKAATKGAPLTQEGAEAIADKATSKAAGATAKTAPLAKEATEAVADKATGKAVEKTAGKAASVGGKAASLGGKAASLGGKAALGAARAVPIAGQVLAAGMAVYDGAQGWNDEELHKEAFGLKEGQEASTGQKASAAAANMLDMGGLLTGAAKMLGFDVSTGDIAKGIHDVGENISSAASSAFKGIADLFSSDKEDAEKKQEDAPKEEKKEGAAKTSGNDAKEAKKEGTEEKQKDTAKEEKKESVAIKPDVETKEATKEDVEKKTDAVAKAESDAKEVKVVEKKPETDTKDIQKEEAEKKGADSQEEKKDGAAVVAPAVAAATTIPRGADGPFEDKGEKENKLFDESIFERLTTALAELTESITGEKKDGEENSIFFNMGGIARSFYGGGTGAGGGGSGGGSRRGSGGGGGGSSKKYEYDPNAKIGESIAKFESGSQGSKAIGYDTTGGTSYGKFQLSSKTAKGGEGSMQGFLRFMEAKGGEHAAIAQRIKAAGPLNTGSRKGAAADQWKKEVSSNQALMEDAQREYMVQKNYAPAMARLQSDELRKRIEGSKALQDAMFSTAVQHGAGNGNVKGAGASNIWNKVYREGMSDEELIKAVYQERGTRFGSSTAQVQASVKNRFRQESEMLIGMNKAEKDAKNITKAASSKKGSEALQASMSASVASATQNAIDRGVTYSQKVRNSAKGAVDCSSWVTELNRGYMDSMNAAMGKEVFSEEAKDVVLRGNTAAGIIQNVSQATGELMTGDALSPENVREGMAIGIDASASAGRDRFKGIDHIAQVYRDPKTGEMMVSHAEGGNINGVHSETYEKFYARQTKKGRAMYGVDINKLADAGAMEQGQQAVAEAEKATQEAKAKEQQATAEGAEQTATAQAEAKPEAQGEAAQKETQTAQAEEKAPATQEQAAQQATAEAKPEAKPEAEGTAVAATEQKAQEATQQTAQAESKAADKQEQAAQATAEAAEQKAKETQEQATAEATPKTEGAAVAATEQKAQATQEQAAQQATAEAAQPAADTTTAPQQTAQAAPAAQDAQPTHAQAQPQTGIQTAAGILQNMPFASEIQNIVSKVASPLSQAMSAQDPLSSMASSAMSSIAQGSFSPSSILPSLSQISPAQMLSSIQLPQMPMPEPIKPEPDSGFAGLDIFQAMAGTLSQLLDVTKTQGTDKERKVDENNAPVIPMDFEDAYCLRVAHDRT